LAPPGPAVEPPRFWAARGTTNGAATGVTQYIEQGDGYVEAGEERKALQAYQQALDLLAQEYPFALVLHKLAARYATPGYTQQAIDAATAALVLDPDDALAYRYRGLAYEDGGDRPQAIRDLQRAARLNDPEAQRTLHAWGIAW
jgi:tetratricopeptide (TPR) repeat protein